MGAVPIGPPPDRLQRAVHGMYATYALRLADEHGVVAGLLRGGPATAEELATATGLDADTLGRLLLVLGGFDLLTVDPAGRWSVPADLAGYLDPADPRHVGGFLAHLVDGTAARMDRLGAYLVKGKAAVDVGEPAPFDVIYHDEAATERFLAAMWSLSFDVSAELVAVADLDSARRLVDVGGASGPFSVAALRRWPALRATVFDLPAVRPYLDRTRARYGLGDRLDFVGGDFFHDELPAGDRIAFGYVLSDWPDDTCVDLLHRARRACEPGGRVLVLDRLFDDDRRGPLTTAVMNLSMHVETHGRHRTAAEYVALLERAGITGCAVRRSSRDKHLIVGRVR